ncbi:hypothetical protein [Streptomyces sp. NRRL F-5630]|uniref:hypothetical protein n=1 Tax=Streptomyces sp. NRRL F-5630 TaxID=1463864 RepID=UPI003D7361CA
MDDADPAPIESERRSRNRLGYAVQLTTVCRPGCSWTIRSIPGPRGPLVTARRGAEVRP